VVWVNIVSTGSPRYQKAKLLADRGDLPNLWKFHPHHLWVAEFGLLLVTLGFLAGLPSRRACTNSVTFTNWTPRSHDAVIRVYDEAGNVIEMHEHQGDFIEW
jgi:hypothetical protein